MNRRTKSIEQRNREIYAQFCVYIRRNTPVMQAYANIAYSYDLSEESIRKIVAQQANR